MLISKSDFWRACKLLFARTLDLRFDGIVFPLTNLRYRQITNSLLSRIEGRLRMPNPFSYPFALQLEPTTQCQLRCPLCPRPLVMKDDKPGHMEWCHYETIMREIGPYLLATAFWEWGEPLLHPRIVEMVGLAHKCGILTLISTNGQIDPEEARLRELAQAGLDMLIISMDGATQPVYETFRKGGRLQQVKRFIEASVRAKRKLNRTAPLINVHMVVTRENEMEVEDIRSFARQARADVFTVDGVRLDYDSDPANPHLPREIKYRSFQYQGVSQAEEYRRMPNLCLKPWQWPTLRYDGTLLICGCDHYKQHALGNVFAAPSFREIWRGKKAQEIRRHFPSNGCADLEFCLRCRFKLDDAIREVDPITDEGRVHVRFQSPAKTRACWKERV